MNATGCGQLDRRVVLQRQNPAAGRDSHGQEIEAWQTMATVWAKVDVLRGREYFAAAAVQRETSVKVRIRYRADVDSTCRVLIDGVPHNIEASLPLGRKEWLDLMCNARPNDGSR